MARLKTIFQWSAIVFFAKTKATDPQRPNKPYCSGRVNTPGSRQCWSPGFDIHTDYEAKIPKGRLREVLH